MSETTEAKKTTVVNKVMMKDGRPVEFVGNRRMLKDYGVEGDSIFVRFDFANGETLKYLIPVSSPIVADAAGHGFSQKGGDSAAGEENVDDMVISVDDTMKRVVAGEWNAKREGGGFSGAGVVVRALAEHTKKTIDEIKAFIEGKIKAAEAKGEKLTRQQLYAALRATPAIKVIIDRLEAEANKGSAAAGEELIAGLTG